MATSTADLKLKKSIDDDDWTLFSLMIKTRNKFHAIRKEIEALESIMDAIQQRQKKAGDEGDVSLQESLANEMKMHEVKYLAAMKASWKTSSEFSGIRDVLVCRKIIGPTEYMD